MLTLLNLRMPNPSESAAAPDAAPLCRDCGLCCNGVLFDRVYLQRGDIPQALTSQGLRIKKGQWFNQPCTALCGTLCRLYHNRPTRCRLFECRQFQQVAAGEIRYESAADRIRQVKMQVTALEHQLTGCGGGNIRKPLAQRYATAVETSRSRTGTPGLTAAMEQLQAELDAHFRLGWCGPSPGLETSRPRRGEGAG